nr:MAG TPA: hypothetical protein [Caudoviricetes sp.]
MKNYTEYTRNEINEITKRGGDDLKKLNKMVADYLDGLDLSDRARAVISDTDFNCMAICFGGMMTAEEIEEDIKEQYGEED